MVANSITILLLLSLVLVYGQLGPFINPSERPNGALPNARTNPVYAVGNLLNVTWTPMNGTVTLTIWQTAPNGSDIGGLQYLSGSSSILDSYYTWDPIGVNGDDNQPDFDLVASNLFHFDLYMTGAVTPSGLSIYFNLTNDTINAQGSVISTATSSVSLPASTGSSRTTTSSYASSQTSSLALSPSSSPTNSVTPSTSPSQASISLNSGAKAGIAVGVSLGGLAVIAGIVNAFLLIRQRRNVRANSEQPTNYYTEKSPTSDVRTEYKAEMEGTTQPQKWRQFSEFEMDGSQQPGAPVELPAKS